MKDWKVSAKKSLKRGHKLVAQALRDLGCRGVDLPAWTVKEPLYTASLLRYKVCSFWWDPTGDLWSHKFAKLEPDKTPLHRVWHRSVHRKGLIYQIRITVYKTGDCKVEMMICAEQAPI